MGDRKLLRVAPMQRDSIKTAGVVLTRERDGQLEVLWARRPASAEFLGGFYSFFVGRVEASDADIALDTSSELAVGAGQYGCALRELFEEAGLLVLSDWIVGSWASEPPGPLGQWDAYRDDLREGAAHFAGDLKAAHLRLGASRLLHLGSWRTPAWIEPAFETDFFSLHLTESESRRLASLLPEHVQSAEIDVAEWIRPERALHRWRGGQALMTTPIVAILEGLARVPRAEWAGSLERRRQARRRDAPTEIMGGVRVLPLRTDTLPPATHTNCYLVGEERFVVVDPGSTDVGQRRLLAAAVDELVESGATFEAIVLTHHHRDHVGGVDSLVQTYDVPVWAHAKIAEHLAGLQVARELGHGEGIVMGEHQLRCVYTPGHASDHLCLHHLPTDSVLVGDLVASKGTIVINPPDGNLGDYLVSLDRIRHLGPRTLLPAHGRAITEADALLEHYIDHRLMRERAVLEALVDHDGPASPMDLVPRVYDDVPRHIWPLAARSLLAHLIYLVEQGRANGDGERFWATVPVHD